MASPSPYLLLGTLVVDVQLLHYLCQQLGAQGLVSSQIYNSQAHIGLEHFQCCLTTSVANPTVLQIQGCQHKNMRQHNIILPTLLQGTGYPGGPAAMESDIPVQSLTFQKQVIPSSVHEVHSPFIPDFCVVVERDSAQTRHIVKVRLMVAQRLFPGLTAPLDLLVLQRGGHINCLQDHKSRTQPQLRLLPSIRHGPESAQLINYPITLPT